MKDVLVAANAAIAAGDVEGFLSHCTDDIRWTYVGGRSLSGKEEVRSFLADSGDDPDRFTVTDLISEGDVVTALGEIWQSDEGGTPVRHQYCDVWRVRDGRLAELRAFVIRA